MKVKEVPFSWIPRWGYRLDVEPFVGGSVEAKLALESLKAKAQSLREVTAGGMSGIINAGRIKRQWVEDPRYGTTFLSSTDILRADLSHCRLISNKAVKGNPRLIIRKGWTLITRAGTVGRMAYARPDMDRMACTEDVLRVVPDDAIVPSGYLFAFLNGKFGIPMVTSGTYGAIIQHIEPEHISDLPVPRLGGKIENEAHQLIEQAATDRSKAAEARTEAIRRATELIHWIDRYDKLSTSEALACSLARRMDAFHHSNVVTKARQALRDSSSAEQLGSVVQTIFEPNRGARRKVEDPAFGVSFLSSSEVFALDPKGDYFISLRHTSNLESLLIMQEDLLVPRSGQVGGIIGRAVLPVPTVYGHAASEHLVRIRCRSHEDACYLWAVLASAPGYWALVGTAFGSSIPSLDCDLISRLNVPWVAGIEREQIVELTQSALRLQDEAIKAERRAIALVEQAIEEAA